MRRALTDGYELDDDPQRIDVDAVHAYLTRSYWAEGRSREAVERLVDAAGLYRRFGFGPPSERGMERSAGGAAAR